jgi:hypothetical protein
MSVSEKEGWNWCTKKETTKCQNWGGLSWLKDQNQKQMCTDTKSDIKSGQPPSVSQGEVCPKNTAWGCDQERKTRATREGHSTESDTGRCEETHFVAQFTWSWTWLSICWHSILASFVSRYPPETWCLIVLFIDLTRRAFSDILTKKRLPIWALSAKRPEFYLWWTRKSMMHDVCRVWTRMTSGIYTCECLHVSAAIRRWLRLNRLVTPATLQKKNVSW